MYLRRQLLLMTMLTTMATELRDNALQRPQDAQAHGFQRKTRTLYIGGIFPMSGSWAGGRGCRPAADIALEHINRRTDLLPDFRLKMLANDSRVIITIIS